LIATLLVTDKIEMTTEVAIKVIDTMAEATEKVAGEVAEVFPGNEDLKEAALKIKAVTDVIEEDVEKTKAPIHKVWLIMQSIRWWREVVARGRGRGVRSQA
jgi:hypothetical protein